MSKRKAESSKQNGPAAKKRRVADATSSRASPADRASSPASATGTETSAARTEGETEDVAVKVNKKLRKLLELGPLRNDLTTVSLNAQRDLSGHLFYAENLRRGLLGGSDERHRAMTKALSNWTKCPLSSEELPPSYREWTLPDQVLAMVSQMCSQKGLHQYSEQAEELVGGSIVLSSQMLVDSVLHKLASDLIRKPTKKGKLVTAKRPDKLLDWRSVLNVLAALEGFPPEILEASHARLSAIYRPADISEHRLERIISPRDP